jgi:hypothetical protein
MLKTCWALEPDDTGNVFTWWGCKGDCGLRNLHKKHKEKKPDIYVKDTVQDKLRCHYHP